MMGGRGVGQGVGILIYSSGALLQALLRPPYSRGGLQFRHSRLTCIHVGFPLPALRNPHAA